MLVLGDTPWTSSMFASDRIHENEDRSRSIAAKAIVRQNTSTITAAAFK